MRPAGRNAATGKTGLAPEDGGRSHAVVSSTRFRVYELPLRSVAHARREPTIACVHAGLVRLRYFPCVKPRARKAPLPAKLSLIQNKARLWGQAQNLFGRHQMTAPFHVINVEKLEPGELHRLAGDEVPIGGDPKPSISITTSTWGSGLMPR